MGVSFVTHYLHFRAAGSSECSTALGTLTFSSEWDSGGGPYGLNLNLKLWRSANELQTLLCQWKACERKEPESPVGNLAQASKVVKPEEDIHAQDV